ncbi:hypothetical protein AZE42_09355 [Rhizopogon vesiculosus]|uniref:Uncharacterized protein n=1 Tax=Rhizopogon vesiculosus TaxID=180088 RepID=A0A1J8R5Y6_9AGAM|nr:hypothetical protein AZE42_09355 [Rhizopogon vesiculosus]
MTERTGENFSNNILAKSRKRDDSTLFARVREVATHRATIPGVSKSR